MLQQRKVFDEVHESDYSGVLSGPRYLTSEVAGGFTGVMIVLYAHSKVETKAVEFYDFKVEYR